MSTTFVPSNGRLLVRPIEATKTTPGGLTIPDSMKQEQQEAEVIASIDEQYGGYAVGTKILLGKWAGSPITIDYEKLLLVSADEVLGYWEEKKEN